MYKQYLYIQIIINFFNVFECIKNKNWEKVTPFLLFKIILYLYANSGQPFDVKEKPSAWEGV